MFLSACNQNYVTTEITIPLVIYITVPLNLYRFKYQLFGKLFNIINTVGLSYIWITRIIDF